MAKGYVPVYFDTLEETVDFTDEEFGRLMRAVISYAMGDADYQRFITGNERYAFRFLKGQVDRNDEISAVRAKARGGKTEQNETKPNKQEQVATNDDKAKQEATNSIKEKEKKKEEEKKKEKERLQNWFEMFWATYPKKQARQDAQKAFLKIAPDEKMLDMIMTALERQKQSQQWSRDEGQFIPYPATWLNGKRWLDQVDVDAKQSTGMKPLAVQNYEQRDYSEREKELRERMMRLAGEVDAG